MKKTTTYKKHNLILEDHGDWIIVDISTPKKPDLSMKIDRVDWDFLKIIGIGRVSYSGTDYIYASTRLNGKMQRVHRIITMFDRNSKNLVVDHINHDTLDNRRSNLRCCTHSQNSMNSIRVSNNVSGKIGVYKNTYKGLWLARICVDGKSIHLGDFRDKSDAIKAREDAERKYFGEYAYDGGE